LNGLKERGGSPRSRLYLWIWPSAIGRNWRRIGRLAAAQLICMIDPRTFREMIVNRSREAVVADPYDVHQLKRLKRSIERWNKWRDSNRDILINLNGADLGGLNLTGAMLWRASMIGANLRKTVLTDANINTANLAGADLCQSKLQRVHFGGATLTGANLRRANLTKSHLGKANLAGADLGRAILRDAYLSSTHLVMSSLDGAVCSGADFSDAKLTDASLRGLIARRTNFASAQLNDADFTGADLSQSDFRRAVLVGTNFQRANLDGLKIYGCSVWNVDLESSHQTNLQINDEGEPLITVDNLEVAQFIYLILNNQKIRHAIDTITTKVVLILGRFTNNRKTILDAIREELRKKDYLPVLFDFDKPSNRDITETVSTLAHMARFVIADLSDPKSIPHELAHVAPLLPSVPIMPLIVRPQKEYAMFEHFFGFRHVLKPFRYRDEAHLLSMLNEKVLAPAEKLAQRVAGRRR
jgi:uncharacterized protein YjbI with pentapeptide repeats